MSIKGTLFKLGIFSLVLLTFTALIFVVFGQIRFNRTTSTRRSSRTSAVCATGSSCARPASRWARSRVWT